MEETRCKEIVKENDEKNKSALTTILYKLSQNYVNLVVKLLKLGQCRIFPPLLSFPLAQQPF